jgi:hypothetical protein
MLGELHRQNQALRIIQMEELTKETLADLSGFKSGQGRSQ